MITYDFLARPTKALKGTNMIYQGISNGYKKQQ